MLLVTSRSGVSRFRQNRFKIIWDDSNLILVDAITEKALPERFTRLLKISLTSLNTESWLPCAVLYSTVQYAGNICLSSHLEDLQYVRTNRENSKKKIASTKLSVSKIFKFNVSSLKKRQSFFFRSGTWVWIYRRWWSLLQYFWTTNFIKHCDESCFTPT